MESFVTVISEDESKASLKNANSNFAATGTRWVGTTRDYTFRSTHRRVFSNPLGVSLLEPMRALNQWTSKNYVWVEKARASYDQVDQTE